MQVRCLFGLAVVAGAAVSANAFEYRCRWVERVGATDIVIGGNGAELDVGDGAPRRIRLQIGVFDDAGGAAPGGGFVGWNVGSMQISGPAANSADRRTNGRLSPWNFATGPNSNGNPPPAGGSNAGDAAGTDFSGWTEIDATLGTQSPFWQGCDAEGNPVPPPPAAVRGRNTFASLFEITTDPNDGGFENYSISASGNLISATEWRIVGNPLPPDCESGTPGQITYAPFPTDPVAFSCVLNLVPAPGAAALLGLGGLLAARRRR
jgi:hypothetical protein